MQLCLFHLVYWTCNHEVFSNSQILKAFIEFLDLVQNDWHKNKKNHLKIVKTLLISGN